MTKYSEEKDNTKIKIIEAAGEIFAEKGYQNTTVRDICKKANVYQLSINYHFGSKENLFKEVLYKTYQDTYEANIEKKVKDLSPEKQLEEIISSRAHSIFSNDKRGYFFKISLSQTAEHNKLFEDIVYPIMKKNFYFVRSVFSEISNNTFDEFELNYCAYLLISHISIFNMFKKAKFILFNADNSQKDYNKENEYNPSEEQLEKFIIYVKKFIFAGVEKMKLEKLTSS